jgi:hypothetical protein
MWPSRKYRPSVARAVGLTNGTVAALPITPEMLNKLTEAIAGGVKMIWYADRRIEFMSLDDLLRAWEWVAGQLGVLVANQPTRRVACFSKGLTGSYLGGIEHEEVADVLWSRGAPPDPARRDDVDWERATGPLP